MNNEHATHFQPETLCLACYADAHQQVFEKAFSLKVEDLTSNFKFWLKEHLRQQSDTFYFRFTFAQADASHKALAIVDADLVNRALSLAVWELELESPHLQVDDEVLGSWYIQEYVDFSD